MSDEKVSEEVQEKLGKLQMMEQNLQNFMMQRQMTQTKLVEVESALEELKGAKEAYKIVGNIMVASKRDELEEDLKDQQETLKRRSESLENQEKKLREKAESLQQEIMKSLK